MFMIFERSGEIFDVRLETFRAVPLKKLLARFSPGHTFGGGGQAFAGLTDLLGVQTLLNRRGRGSNPYHAADCYVAIQPGCIARVHGVDVVREVQRSDHAGSREVVQCLFPAKLRSFRVSVFAHTAARVLRYSRELSGQAARSVLPTALCIRA